MRIHRRRRQDHFCINRILLFFPLFLQPLCRRRLSFVSIYFHWLVPVLCVNINHPVHASRQNTPNGGKWAATENWAAKRETKNCTRNQHTKCCLVFSARWIFRTMLDASLRARATRSVSISKGSMFAQSYTHQQTVLILREGLFALFCFCFISKNLICVCVCLHLARLPCSSERKGVFVSSLLMLANRHRQSESERAKEIKKTVSSASFARLVFLSSISMFLVLKMKQTNTHKHRFLSRVVSCLVAATANIYSIFGVTNNNIRK